MITLGTLQKELEEQNEDEEVPHKKEEGGRTNGTIHRNATSEIFHFHPSRKKPVCQGSMHQIKHVRESHQCSRYHNADCGDHVGC